MSTEIETKVSVRRNNGEIVSADVSMYNDTGDVVKKITIIDSNALASLEATISGFEEVYVDNEQLETILANINESTNINATKLNGFQSDAFAKTNHSHTGYAPTNHSSNSNEYGVGSTSNYGHVKTVNNLNTPSYISGESLSAFQGKLLDDKILELNSVISDLKEQYYKNSLNILVGRSSDNAGEEFSRLEILSGKSIYARLICDKPDVNLSGQIIRFYINGVVYEKTTDNNGKATLNINLNTGSTVLLNVVAGINGLNPASTAKVIEVL